MIGGLIVYTAVGAKVGFKKEYEIKVIVISLKILGT